MPRQNIKLIVAYDGTNYLGWQKTSMGPSIEESLEIVICRILQHLVHIQAASRTDAGVHALGQVAQFYTDKEITDVSKFRISLNALLPLDIKVLQVEMMPLSFHPTLDAKGKIYHYQLCYSPVQLPQNRLYEWHYHYPLDVEAMRAATLPLLGEHDFAAFCNAKKNEVYSHHIRKVTRIEIQETGLNQILFIIEGEHFLYKMVRNLVGTLTYIGSGKISVDAINKILEDGKRTYAGVTAPARGLTLQKVVY